MNAGIYYRLYQLNKMNTFIIMTEMIRIIKLMILVVIVIISALLLVHNEPHVVTKQMQMIISSFWRIEMVMTMMNQLLNI